MLSLTLIKLKIILATAFAFESLGQLIYVLRQQQLYVLRHFLFRGKATVTLPHVTCFTLFLINKHDT